MSVPAQSSASSPSSSPPKMMNGVVQNSGTSVSIEELKKEIESLKGENERLSQELKKKNDGYIALLANFKSINDNHGKISAVLSDKQKANTQHADFNARLAASNIQLAALTAENIRLRLASRSASAKPISINLDEGSGLLGAGIVGSLREQQTLMPLNVNDDPDIKEEAELLASAPIPNTIPAVTALATPKLIVASASMTPISSSSVLSSANATAANSAVPQLSAPSLSTRPELLINSLPCYVSQLETAINVADKQLNDFFQILNPGFASGLAGSPALSLDFDDETETGTTATATASTPAPATASASANSGKVSPNSPNGSSSDPKEMADQSPLELLLSKAERIDKRVNLTYMALNCSAFGTSSQAPEKVSFFKKVKRIMDQVDAISKEKDALHNQKEKLLEANTELRQTLDQLKTGSTKAPTIKDALTHTETQKQKVDELEVKELRALKDENEKEISALNKKLQAMQSLEKEKKTLKDEIDGYLDTISTQQSTISELGKQLKSDKTTCLHQISEQRKEIEQCGSKLKLSENLVQTEKVKNLNLAEKNKALTAQMQTMALDIKKRQEEMGARIAALKQKYDDLQSQKEQTESDLNNRISSLTLELSKKQTNTTSAPLSLSVGSLLNSPSFLMSPSSATASAPATTSELEQAHETILKLTEENKRLTQQIQKLTADLKNKEKEKSEAIAKKEAELKKEISDFKKELEARIAALELELKNRQKKVDEWARKHDLVVDMDLKDKAGLRKQLMASEAQNKDSLTKLETERNKNRRLESSHAATQSTLDAANAEIALLKKRLAENSSITASSASAASLIFSGGPGALATVTASTTAAATVAAVSSL